MEELEIAMVFFQSLNRARAEGSADEEKGRSRCHEAELGEFFKSIWVKVNTFIKKVF